VPFWKDPPGTTRKAQLARADEIKRDEEREKRKVRKRDKACRRPNCPHCRDYGGRLALHVAHLTPKGMGGDKTGRVTKAELMIRLDSITHTEQERGLLDIRPLTARGTYGTCEFWWMAGETPVLEGVA